MLLRCPPWLVAQPSKTLRIWQFVPPIHHHADCHHDKLGSYFLKSLTLNSLRIDIHDPTRNPRHPQRSKRDFCTGLTTKLRARKFAPQTSASVPPHILRILPPGSVVSSLGHNVPAQRQGFQAAFPQAPG